MPPSPIRDCGQLSVARKPIIYYIVTRKGLLYLLDVYAKSAKEDLTDAEKREIRKLAAAIDAED